MPRAKKKIKVEVHLPVLEKQREFQERVNGVYIGAIENYLKKNNIEKKEQVLERLEQTWSAIE